MQTQKLTCDGCGKAIEPTPGGSYTEHASSVLFCLVGYLEAYANTTPIGSTELTDKLTALLQRKSA
jgi:hypothetical protein